ncbi:MAG: hypothetical protein ACK55I_30030, partial [bacterium]
QYRLLSEQSMTGWANYVPQEKQKDVIKGWDESLTSHNMNTILGIASVMVPVIGPILTAAIGVGDSLKYFQEGKTKTATIGLLFSLIPLSAKLLRLVPELSQIGLRGSVALVEKLISNSKLVPAETQILKKIATNKNVIETELKSIGTLLKPVEPIISKYKQSYISKFGEAKYTTLLSQYISKQINQDQFSKSLANSK